MIVRLSPEEMLRVWKLRRYHEPLRADCEVTRADGLDLERLQMMEMKEWYLKQLDTADTRLLEVSDIAKDVALKRRPDGSATITLPEECRRVVEVSLDGWLQPTRLATPGSRLALLQQSEFSRGGVTEPVAVMHTGYIHLYSPPAEVAAISTLKCICEPLSGEYVMDEILLETIKHVGYEE